MAYEDELTMLEKIALEGEIALMLSSAMNNTEVLYRYYCVKEGTKSEYVRNNIRSVVTKLVDLPSVDLNRLDLEITMNKFPVWLWTDLIISDVKVALSVNAQSKNENARTTEITRSLIRSSLVTVLRSASEFSPSATRELCRKIIEEEGYKLSFLEDVCSFFMRTLSESKESKKENEKGLQFIRLSFKDTLTFEAERKANRGQKKNTRYLRPSDIARMEMEKEQKTKEYKVVRDAEVEGMEDAEYLVRKTYRNGTSMVIRQFKTEQEAEEYVELIKLRVPDLMDTILLTVEKKRGLGSAE